MKTYISIIIAALFISMISIACNNGGKEPDNPFDEYNGGDSTGGPIPPSVDPRSFAGLHYYIFSPTCANSGCHDGTFEPDFRTVESAYNTLVLHPVIKNDPNGTFTYRVAPNNADKSVIIKRLTADIDGQSGTMPLSVEPGSNWFEKRNDHIANIRSWIEGGAKDIFGNLPVNGDIPPSMRGVIAFADGATTILDRQAGSGPILVSVSASTLEMWFSVSDDNTAAEDLGHNKAKLSYSINEFTNINERDLSIASSPITEVGYFGDPVQYYHSISIDLSQYNIGDHVFIRIYLKDPAHSNITEIPTNGSADYTKEYFSFKIQ